MTSKNNPNSVMWFRRDLRLEDNPALIAASKTGAVTPLFVLDPMFLQRSGAPRLAFLFRSLRELNREMNGSLVVRVGDPTKIVPQVAHELAAVEVFAAKDFAPYGQKRDVEVGRALEKVGAKLNHVGSAYAVEPGIVRKADATPYSVFTPFSKVWLAHGWSAPAKKPTVNWNGAPAIKSESIPDDPSLTAKIADAGEKAAWKRWEHFVETALDKYKSERNNPDRDGCSQMSVYLRFGVVHPRQLLAELEPNPNHDHYRSELCWREFYADVLFHQPHTIWKNLQPKMDSLQVDTDVRAKERFEVWCAGKTGYPIVDAPWTQLDRGLFAQYPEPMVDHSKERDEALSRYKISGEINRSVV
ncbi:MAG: hypothetical protein EBV51_04115 [Acidimicrobiia bacterium]|nr:hypothetical protein [Acidimicrobiia bacterium]